MPGTAPRQSRYTERARCSSHTAYAARHALLAPSEIDNDLDANDKFLLIKTNDQRCNRHMIRKGWRADRSKNLDVITQQRPEAVLYVASPERRKIPMDRSMQGLACGRCAPCASRQCSRTSAEHPCWLLLLLLD